MGTFGKYLREKRMEGGMALEDIASRSTLSENVLNALENSDSDFFRGQLYFRNFLNEYLAFLKIDRDFFYREFSGELESLNKTDHEYIVKSITGLRYSNFRNRLTIIKWALAGIIVAVLIYFLLIDRSLQGNRKEGETPKQIHTEGAAAGLMNPGETATRK